MEFSAEEIEKLAEELIAGTKNGIPDKIELLDSDAFLKFFVTMGVYIMGISKCMDSINKRLETIELNMLEKSGVGSA